MKLKNKILAGVLAIVVGLGVIGLPQIGKLITNAFSPIASTETLEVKNVEKAYGVGDENNKIKFSDYCSTPNAKVELRRPDGEVLYAGDVITVISGGGGSTEYHNEAKFRNPGLYAMQFKLNSNGVNIYSDVIYIPVGSDSVGTISLDGKLNSVVAPNTAVNIPMPINADWTEDNTVTIKVYTPYGEEVEATKSSVSGKWSFVNKPGVLGNYFVEYTKRVIMGGFYQTYYKYEQIEFSAESINTVSTVDFEKKQETSTTNEPQIVTANMDVAKEKNYIYIFKKYDIKNVYVTKADGSTDTEAEIFVSILDATTNKYYDFTTSKDFTIENEADAKLNINDPKITEFVLTKIENLASFSATGHKIVFKYTATSGGAEITPATVEKTEKFELKDIVVTPTQTVQSEQTNITKVDDVDGYDVASMWFPGVTISTNGNYNVDAIKSLVTAVRLTLSPESGSSVETSETKNEVDSNGVGLLYTTGNVLGRTFTYYYNKNMEKEMRYEVIYAVDLKYDENTTSITTNDIYTYFRTESKDKTAPSKLTIGAYSNYISSKEFTVPTATVKDTDDLGNTTSGASIVAKIYGGSYSGTSVTMGSNIAVLVDGTYTIKYTATDFKGNSRTKSIHFIVDADQSVTAPTLTVGATDVAIDGVDVTITTDTNADYCMVYGGTNGGVTPSKLTMEDGKISALEFELVSQESPTVVVFAKTSTYSTVYSAIQVVDGIVENTFKSFGYSALNNGYIRIIPNTTQEANVQDKLLWFGSDDMVIEAPEKGAYTVRSGNIITFLVAGTYTITSNEVIEINGEQISVPATTTLVIKNTTTKITATQPIGNKIVGKKGVEVVVNYPVATNFFGYDLEVVVKDSAGNLVNNVFKNDGVNISFVPPADDVYTINFTLRAEDFAKGESVITYTTGNIARPKVNIIAENKNVTYQGETIKYVLADANAMDKNGKSINVYVSVFDKYGQPITVKTEGTSRFVELKSAGFYTVYYTAVDEFGKEAIATTTFAVEFPESQEDDGLSAWAIVGIVLGSLAGAALIAFVVIVIIKKRKNAVKFINKSKATKKKDKKEMQENQIVYTIAESKDEKHWTLKTGNRTIAKCETKQAAVDKAKEVHKKGEAVIKVYNKSGRLVDNIKQ